mgnify:CR=1 FL=1
MFGERNAVRGEHLAVRVDVDAVSRSLLQQKPQIVQIMATDHDEQTRSGRAAGCS